MLKNGQTYFKILFKVWLAVFNFTCGRDKLNDLSDIEISRTKHKASFLARFSLQQQFYNAFNVDCDWDQIEMNNFHVHNIFPNTVKKGDKVTSLEFGFTLS